MADKGLSGSVPFKRADMRRMLKILGIGPATRLELKKLEGVIGPRLGEIVDHWFDRQSAHPAMRDLLNLARKRGHLGPGMVKQLSSMLGGRYGAEYFASRRRVGLIHEKVGVEPSWYMGAWRTVADIIGNILEEEKVPPADRVSLLSAMEKVVELDQAVALDAYFEAKNSAILDANRELSELFQELKRKNKKLGRQYRKVREAARIKEEFLSRISHELRTPLNAIIGYSDILIDGIDGPLTADQERSVGTIHRSGEALLDLIEKIISASRMAAAGGTDSEYFDMADAVGGAVGKYREMAAARGLEFVLAEPGRKLPAVFGDREAFAAALGQVLDNAVKFTRQGGVRIDFESGGSRVSVVVSDTGPGIPAKERDRVFDAFHQVDGGDDRAHQGIGMGLTFAFRAMRAMGGELTLLDRKGPGAAFSLSLPVEPEGGSGVEP